MKTNRSLSDICKECLSARIQRYIDKRKEECRYNQAKFAKEVMEKLGYAGHETESTKSTKNVYKWLNKEAFPNIPTLVAISRVIGCTLDELFTEAVETESPLRNLTEEEKNVLIDLIEARIVGKSESIAFSDSLYTISDQEDEETKKNVGTIENPFQDGEFIYSSVYLPYKFENGDKKRFFDAPEKLYKREEIVSLYKQLTEDAFRADVLKSFGKSLLGKNLTEDRRKKAEDVFPLMLSVMVQEGYGNKSICYDGTGIYYEKMESVWAETGRYDINNVIYFEEVSTGEIENELDFFGGTNKARDYLYKNFFIKKDYYKATFSSLLEKGLIEPIADDIKKYSDEITMKAKRGIQFTRFMDFEGDQPIGDYTLECFKFNFKICLPKKIVHQILIENYEKTLKGEF